MFIIIYKQKLRYYRLFLDVKSSKTGIDASIASINANGMVVMKPKFLKENAPKIPPIKKENSSMECNLSLSG